jgi:hypothetical protein
VEMRKKKRKLWKVLATTCFTNCTPGSSSLVSLRVLNKSHKMGYERRLRHTALSSTSPTHPNSSSSTTSPLCRSLSPSRSTTSSSSASSTPTPSITTTRKRYTKNRTRKSLAEEQELHRIMDPVYLGQDRYCSNNRGGGCCYHADPEGYWHDIDYRPFRRIREKERSWTLPESESELESLCEDDVAFGRRGMKATGDGRKREEGLAYWETFMPVGRYVPTLNGHLDEASGCAYSTLRSRTPPSPTLPHWSSSCHHSYPDLNESNDDEKHRGLLKKKKRTRNDLSNSHDEYPSSSSGDEWLSSSTSDPEKDDTPKPKPQTLNSRSKMILRKTWITTTFIARLKVIRTKRWLRERVVVVLSS